MSTEPPVKRGLSAQWAVKEVDYLFSRLGRYTKFVLYSKWFLMLFAVGLLTTLIALPLVSHNRSGIRVSFVDSSGSKDAAATSPVMNNPEYSGASAKGDQFKVNGIRATQLTSTSIRIDKVEAQMMAPNGTWRSLTANTAVYDQDANTLRLEGDLTLIDNQGYTFTTASADVETDTMNIDGHEPISGVGPMGNLLATGFQIRDSGNRITFTSSPAQRVKLHLDRSKK